MSTPRPDLPWPELPENTRPNREEWKRACKLINHMAAYMGKMAPGSYNDFYADLNEHFIAEAKLKALWGEIPA